MKEKLYARFSVFCAAILLCVVLFGSLRADAASNAFNSSYQPGAVLIYQNGDWKVATPDAIDYSENNYVYVHGAHSKAKAANDKMSAVADAVKKRDPNANFFAIDWRRFSSFEEDRLDEIIQEHLAAYAFELILTAISDNVNEEKSDYDEIFARHFGAFIGRVIMNVIPVEQTRYIPAVADRACSLLFGEKGTSWKFTTNGEEESFLSLELDPSKTHLIGHSHGAHIAGMIGMQCKSETGRQVKRLTALDPSPAATQLSEENKDGNGWNRTAAKLVDVYRTSELCSSDKIYGDVNVYYRSANHPFYRIENCDNPLDGISLLGDGISFDVDLHTKCVDLFIEEIANDSNFLKYNSSSYGNSVKWDVYDRGSTLVRSPALQIQNASSSAASDSSVATAPPKIEEPELGEPPLAVTIRESLADSDYQVLCFKNNSGKILSGRCVCTANSGATKTFDGALKGYEYDEIGWMQGWDWVSGESATFYLDGYAPVKYTLN